MHGTSLADQLTATVRVADWTLEASCQNTPIKKFFLPPGHELQAEIRVLCGSCPVRRECLCHAYGVGGGPRLSFGYFGGLSPMQRKQLGLDQALALID